MEDAAQHCFAQQGQFRVLGSFTEHLCSRYGQLGFLLDKHMRKFLERANLVKKMRELQGMRRISLGQPPFGHYFIDLFAKNFNPRPFFASSSCPAI
eukprot:3996343-Amphidinium_carterae.1